jgi:hypothetical protein
MATTLMPLDPATSPQRAARILNISADLLPAEVIDARRGRKVRGRVIAVLLVFVVLLGSWYAYTWQQARDARSDLDDVTAQAQSLQRSQSQYADVVNVQAERDTIAAQLKTLLGNDLSWRTLLGKLRSTGTSSNIVVTGMNGSLASSTETSAAASKLPSTTTSKVIGTLTVTGTAPDKDSLAKYVDALGDLEVVANPYLTSAAETEDTVQFSLQVDITASALGGRFTSTTATGGK